MSRRVIVVSPPGQRITLHADGTLDSEPHADEGYSTVILQAGPPPPPPPRPGPPPPPPDISMTFVAGLPGGLDPHRLAEAPVVRGPVSIHDLQTRLRGAGDHLAEVVVLRGGDG